MHDFQEPIKVLDALKSDKPLEASVLRVMSHYFHMISEKSARLFVEKNERYDASFFRQCVEDGDLSSVPTRLTDKLNRFKSLVKNPDLDNTDESVKDTLVDLANYATMALVFLELMEIDKE